jgi:electron transfer flavoprotein alpha subunit
MSRVYVFSENLQLAAELVTTAATLGEVHVVCLGAAGAATLAGAGATSVVALEGDQSRPEAYAPALAHLVGERGGDLLLVGATVSGWEIAARAAAILGIGLVSEATALRAVPDGAWCSERIMFAGGAVQTETWTGPAVVTIAQGQAAAASGGAVDVETVVVATDSRVRVVARTARERSGTDLASAARVVCVGMGLKKVEDLALAGDLADALGAEIACTRPVAEDREWLPVEQYIGISGVKVRPDLYVGLGVSGQVQHTIGIRDAKVVVGINTDPDATLFAVCDYAVVGSLYEIAPLLAAAVRDR